MKVNVICDENGNIKGFIDSLKHNAIEVNINDRNLLTHYIKNCQFYKGKLIHKRKHKDVIIQAGTANYTKLLDICSSSHSRYADKYDFDYWQIRTAQQNIKTPHWDKILLIQQALENEYEQVFWLDADSLILQDVDLRLALKNTDRPLGMVRYPYPEDSCPSEPLHYNSGVIAIKNTKETKMFFKEVWEEEGDNIWWEQRAINNLLENKWKNIIHSMSPIWNSCKVAVVDNPIIYSWHSDPLEKRINEMKRAIAERNKEINISNIKQLIYLRRLG